ncbi:MAG: cytochrome C [Planctomycetota bacterium]|nr:MAG: cytochrome C [Planctomycetota bacterium]
MNARWLLRVFGPRTPHGLTPQERAGFVAPTILFTLAATLLLVSIFLPYWRMTLYAPQYPNGLHLQAYVNRLEGDVREIDMLNHYIGMRKLEDAAQLERSLSIGMIVALTLIVVAAAFVHSPLTALLTLPAILFPLFFLVDLHIWMRFFGQHLNPEAPLSHAIKPFVPPVLGEGKIGQFRTVATPGEGLLLSSVATVLTIVGLFLQRMAYKPLRDRLLREAERRATEES